MSLINILIAVNGQQLAQQVSDGSLQSGTQDNPTYLGSYTQSNVYITMVTQAGNVDNTTQGQSELQVKANSGDSLRWVMQTFDGNQDYTAYLYAGQFNPSTNISSLQFMNLSTSTYLPSGDVPTSQPVVFHSYSYAAQGNVIQYGQQIQYDLSFALVQNSTGDTVGYFKWDPFINVSP